MSTLPRLLLEQDPADHNHISLIFDPKPETWAFDANKGTRDQLRQELEQTVQGWLQTREPGAVFDLEAAKALRGAVLFVVLQWLTFRGLRLAAGG